MGGTEGFPRGQASVILPLERYAQGPWLNRYARPTISSLVNSTPFDTSCTSAG